MAQAEMHDIVRMLAQWEWQVSLAYPVSSSAYYI